jgi:multiple sugar transport system substrate-binding protein
MKFKKLASLGATAATLLGMVAGGTATAATASASPKVSFTWWTWTTNPQNVIANFEKAYPNISIPKPPEYGSGGTFYSKLTTAMSGGTGPCVTQVEYDHLPQFLGAHDLVNISQYVNKYKKDFPGWVWGQVSQNGGVYAMPEDIGPMGLMYQPGVLKKYNLPVPTTWTQFASDAVALHKANPKMWFDYFAPNDADVLESLWWQAGARPYVLQPNGTWKVQVDGPVEEKVLNFWGNLVKEGAVKVSNDFTADWGHQIGQGDYAAMVGAGWSPTYMVATYQAPNSKQQWAVTQMPQWTPGAHATANWGGSTNAVTKDCPAKDVKYAALFAAYINTSKSGLTIDEKPATATGGGRGLFPAALARATIPQFNSHVPYFAGNVNALFNTYAGQVVTNFEWSPWDTEFGNFVTTQLAKAAAGSESWDKALQVTQSQLVSYAKSAGYSVQG